VLDLVAEEGMGQAQRVGSGGSFEQGLLLADLQAEQGGQQVGQPQRIVGPHQQPAQLLRSLRLSEGDGLGGQIDDFVLQRLHLRPGVIRQRQRLHGDFQVRLRRFQPEQIHAGDAQNDQLHGRFAGARHALDHRPRSHGIHFSQAGRFHRRIALGRDHDLLLFGGHGGFHRRHRRRPAHGERHQQVREEHAILQGQQRQDFGLFAHGHDRSPLHVMRITRIPSRNSSLSCACCKSQGNSTIRSNRS
jgi:hypothetical protein